MNPSRDETILGSGRFLELRVRDGWEYVARRGITEVVVVVAVTAAQEAVFVEQYRLPVDARIIEWAAGLVGDEEGEDGEQLFDAAHRELEEETGYQAGRMTLLGRGPSSCGLTSEIITFVQALDIEKVGPGGGVGSEDIQVHLVPLPEVDDWLQEREQEGLLIDPKVPAGLYFLSRSSPRS